MQNSKTFGKCVTCHRDTPLTKHYLIPKKRHKKKNDLDAMMTLFYGSLNEKRGIK